MRKMCSLVPNDLTTHFDFKTPKILKITLQAMKKKRNTDIPFNFYVAFFGKKSPWPGPDVSYIRTYI